MRHFDVTLDDKFLLDEGRVFITGVQALLRILLDQRRLDAAAGLNTAGFLSGYRGSPLGGLDQQAQRAEKLLRGSDILFQAGLNEDLAATAVWGSQQANLFPGARYDGVFGMWYGKAPGVDRTGDAFRHANFAGTWGKGGVLAVAGDDHACKSSTLPSQSEFAFQDLEMPVLSPADVQEVLDFGLLGYALSRFSGLWVGLIALADTMDCGMTIEVGARRHRFITPDFRLPPDGLGIRTKDAPVEKERRLRGYKLPAALAFARANRIDRVVLQATRPRLGVVCHGQAYKDVLEALAAMGLSPAEAADLGVAIYKIGMPWPLEPAGLKSFAAGLETLMVIEHKRPIVETQARAALYDLPAQARPTIIGKTDERGHPLLSDVGALSTAEIALALADRLPPGPHMERVHDYLSRVSAASMAAVTLASDQQRKPYFCSGCPHNTSTRLPEGSRALAGIGCHYMASFSDPNTDLTSHMGGEGLTWVGTAPFTEQKHVFVNLGDGTYNHSGSLAVRAAVAAKANITYKLLFNDAVAMTGGQRAESGFTVPQITRQLAAEGVVRTVVVAAEPERYAGVTDLAPGVEVRPRAELMKTQRELREIPGVTVLIYDQVCATEKRRRRKRGTLPAAAKRVMINPLVCEGCGDCSQASRCVSVEPLETEFGRKRAINQSSCNTDFSCLDGFCPSFVTVEGGENARRAAGPAPAAVSSLPLPPFESFTGVRNIVFTGVGGAGVTTVASILAMAAHVDGRAASVVDMTGLAQKGGAVFSHVRLGETEQTMVGGRVPSASAHVLIACDVLVAASPEALALYAKDRTVAVGNGDFAPTADFVTDRDVAFDAAAQARRIAAAVKSYDQAPAHSLAEQELGDAIYANMIMLGFAWQKGVIPISSRALYRAIRLNGVDAEANLAAFELGRKAAAEPDQLATARPPATPDALSLDELIARRAEDLAAYQNAAYARRYLEQMARVRAAEAPLGSEALTRAAAVSLHKLMAYKDEYEVARLYSDGRFARVREASFKGGKAKVLLSPPLLAPKDADGRPKKIAFGGWMLDVGFPLLARLKGLRGTPLDPFGRTAERRMERKLIADYEASLERIAAELTAERLELAIKIAALPQQIRGFGHVKEAAIGPAKAAEAKLWGEWAGELTPA